MITIIDYKAGNLTSVKRALDFLDIPATITPDPEAVRTAERIIFPGVGNAQSAIATLRQSGLDTAIIEAFRKGTPIMGICLGTQIILSRSDEGNVTCLGLIEGTVRRFSLIDPLLKIPHMGWDSIRLARTHPVLRTIRPDDEFYFVHSYYPLPDDPACIAATCEYETTFPAVIACKNIVATQFHPEKSGPAGLQLLKNFSSWDGSPC